MHLHREPTTWKHRDRTWARTLCCFGLFFSSFEHAKTSDLSKPVKQEANGTVILPPLVFPGESFWNFPSHQRGKLRPCKLTLRLKLGSTTIFGQSKHSQKCLPSSLITVCLFPQKHHWTWANLYQVTYTYFGLNSLPLLDKLALQITKLSCIPLPYSLLLHTYS